MAKVWGVPGEPSAADWHGPHSLALAACSGIQLGMGREREEFHSVILWAPQDLASWQSEEGSQNNRQFSFSPNPVVIFLSAVSHCQLLTVSGNWHWQEEQGEGSWLITSKLPNFKAEQLEWLYQLKMLCLQYPYATPKTTREVSNLSPRSFKDDEFTGLPH